MRDKTKQATRQRRLDLINDMPVGKQKEIARICNCSKGYVSAVLNGHKNQTSDKAINIIRLAERSAERQRIRYAVRKVKRRRTF